MTMTTISILSLLALIFSLCTVSFSILAYCKVVGLENSTHKIQYMPMDEFSQIKEEEPQEMGMPMTGEQKAEKKRVESLGENFGQMYED